MLVSVVPFCTLQELRVTGLFILSHPGKLSALTHCCLSSDTRMVRIFRQLCFGILQLLTCMPWTSAVLTAPVYRFHSGVPHPGIPILFMFVAVLTFLKQFLALAAEEFFWLCALVSGNCLFISFLRFPLHCCNK